jgi:isoleucyl-tRNA synthetase
VVDGEGRKFSKSLGNGVEPRQLLEKYGMDIIRLWVASSDYSEDIRYSPTIMEGMSEAYRRFRNTFRWLLGNLHGFDAKKDAVAYENLPELEQYILHRFHDVLGNVRKHFDEYQFHKAYRELYEFCGGDLSNFYFDVRKDVLYCDPAKSAERLGCLTVLDILLRGLCTHLAPIVPFTADEVWRAYGHGESVHLSTFVAVEKVWKKDEEFALKWKDILSHRNFINIEIEKERGQGKIGGNAEAYLLLPFHFQHDAKADELWRLVMGASGVDFEGDAIAVSKHPGCKCPRCWRYYDKLETSGVCARCDEAMKDL